MAPEKKANQQIRESGGTFYLKNSFGIGDYNTYYADNCIFRGNNLRVFGQKNQIIGNDCFVGPNPETGEPSHGNTMTGERNDDVGGKVEITHQVSYLKEGVGEIKGPAMTKAQLKAERKNGSRNKKRAGGGGGGGGEDDSEGGFDNEQFSEEGMGIVAAHGIDNMSDFSSDDEEDLELGQKLDAEGNSDYDDSEGLVIGMNPALKEDPSAIKAGDKASAPKIDRNPDGKVICKTKWETKVLVPVQGPLSWTVAGGRVKLLDEKGTIRVEGFKSYTVDGKKCRMPKDASFQDHEYKGAIFVPPEEVEQSFSDMDTEGLCIICYRRKAKVVFSPCGCEEFCVKCARDLGNDPQPECPNCDGKITKMTRKESDVEVKAKAEKKERKKKRKLEQREKEKTKEEEDEDEEDGTTQRKKKTRKESDVEVQAKEEKKERKKKRKLEQREIKKTKEDEDEDEEDGTTQKKKKMKQTLLKERPPKRKSASAVVIDPSQLLAPDDKSMSSDDEEFMVGEEGKSDRSSAGSAGSDDEEENDDDDDMSESSISADLDSSSSEEEEEFPIMTGQGNNSKSFVMEVLEKLSNHQDEEEDEEDLDGFVVKELSDEEKKQAVEINYDELDKEEDKGDGNDNYSIDYSE